MQSPQPEDRVWQTGQWVLRSGNFIGGSPGNTPRPRQVRRVSCSLPEPPRKHDVHDVVPFTPFQFVAGTRSIQTCPSKRSYRLQRAPAKQHRVKAVRRSLDLRSASGMAMQSCGKPELQRPVWRLRRPLTGRAKQGTKVQLRSPDFVQRQLCRTPLSTPAPLFSLSEAEETIEPGQTQGRRGLPPLARSLRKRSQEDNQLRANNKMRAVQEPGHEEVLQHNEGAMQWDEAQSVAQSKSTSSVSPSSRMAGLHLRELPL
ncbi:hypothetical protein CVIRNUC_006095 [Coccomyxa viridis]|uniref:Uncharacterized protein n=1 Tax=Coccomyxa viridis TaxID=1274662 RepID=A0AAV1IA44_9CHLO|nr:hypothetical protein CVIRNUC_006095 [Coccomyxa viridis]